MVNLPNLTNEAVSVFFFVENVKPSVSEFTFEVDRTCWSLEFNWKSLPVTVPTMPDGIWGRRVYVEFKSGDMEQLPGGQSARALLQRALEILPSAAQTMGKARSWYSVNTRCVDDPSFLRFFFPYYVLNEVIQVWVQGS